MTEKEYRNIRDRYSFSSVKVFAEDRIKYYKKFVLGNFIEEEMSTAMKLGTVTDCLWTSPTEFDANIVVASCLIPTGQIGDFTQELVEITKQSLDENLVVTRDLQDMMLDAFNAVKYNRKGEEVKFKKKTFEYAVSQFIGTDAELYYKVCRSEFGRTVVDLNLMDAAKKTLEEMQLCEWTKDIINAKTGGNIEVLDQLPLLFDIMIGLNIPIPFKGKPDRVIIDHEKKTITPYDLKVSYTGEDFQMQYWKMKYYLQIASYFLGLTDYKTRVRPELADYEITGVEFIVASSTLNSNPLLFSTNHINITEGLYGFTLKSGRKYKGLYELVSEIEWHKKEQVWRNSKEVYDKKGKMIIRPFEEVEE